MREFKFRVFEECKNEWYYFVLPWSGDLYWSNCLVKKTLGQFTGLKDKNGKEIYEGDILQGAHLQDKWVIVWPKDQGGFVMKRGMLEAALFNKETQKRIVIGNIYENPELLKV